jgi:citrate lyase subunit beta/citryl-CoA lyase
MGFQGKFLIHPRQVEPVNRVFSPSPEDVERARAVWQAFEAAREQGFAATSLDGSMIDIAVAEKAHKVLLLAEKIAAQEGKRV